MNACATSNRKLGSESAVILRNEAKKFLAFNSGWATGAEHSPMILRCCAPAHVGSDGRLMHKRKRPWTWLNLGTFVEQPSPEVCSQRFQGSRGGVKMARMGLSEATGAHLNTSLRLANGT